MPANILLCGPVRYRPECPDVLPQHLDAVDRVWRTGWPPPFYAVHADGNEAPVVRMLDHLRFTHRLLPMQTPPDRRTLHGPRHTGEIQRAIALLRTACLEHAARLDPVPAVLMVDSDIVLSATAASYLWAVASTRWDRYGPCTVSALVDNRLAKDDPPCSNALVQVPSHDSDHNPCGPGPHLRQAPWADDRSVLQVARSGGCTLYHPDVVHHRFVMRPGDRDEQDGLFDNLTDAGWRHYLIRSTDVARSVRPLQPTMREQLEALRGRTPGVQEE